MEGQSEKRKDFNESRGLRNKPELGGRLEGRI